MKRIMAFLLAALLAASASAAMAEPLPLGEDSAIGNLPGKQWELHGLLKTKVTKVSQVTGEESPNKTQSRFGVWGVDLGSMAVIGDTTYMFGGDTFGDKTAATGAATCCSSSRTTRLQTALISWTPSPTKRASQRSCWAASSRTMWK
jgi:hypothetical protein